MANKQYTQRAGQMLDLSYDMVMFLLKVKECCKGAVAHSATQKMLRLENEKEQLNCELKMATLKGSSSLFGWIKTAGVIKEIKRRIAEINNKIVFFITQTIKYFGLSHFVLSCS